MGRRNKMNYDNEYCELAAEMLNTEADLLDYLLVERLNRVADYVEVSGRTQGTLRSRQVIASIIVQWEGDK